MKNYYSANSEGLFKPEAETVEKILEFILSKTTFEFQDLKKIEQIFNSIKTREHYNGSAWYDFKIRLSGLFHSLGYETKFHDPDGFITVYKKQEAPDKTIELPAPWYWDDHNLNGQLRKEVGPFHPLFYLVRKTLARGGSDDVLYKLYFNYYAVVHLTWSSRKKSWLYWTPHIEFYKNWKNVYEKCILHDHGDFKLEGL
ncbi:MAG: hypothetical protein K0S32_2794 [Bacteroidetes bacterium]|nr:hypothetical protein [Bacteroidota bacterium]